MLIRTRTSIARPGVYRRVRLLPRPGKIYLRRGQQVDAEDVIGTACPQPGLITLDVDLGLHLAPQRCAEAVQRRVGETVSQGDLIASGPPGFLQRTLRAPADGIVRWIGEGKVLLETQETREDVLAIYPGVVTDLLPERGVIIETHGRRMQGVWGNGMIARGRLLTAAGRPEGTLDDAVRVGWRPGSIVAAGACRSEHDLKRAAALSPAGLILSSMTAKLNAFAESCAFPILIMEGFGEIAYNDPAWEQIKKLEGCEAVINAAQTPCPAQACEVLILESQTGEQKLPPAGLSADDAGNWTPFYYPGQQVRVLQTPYRGRAGVIEHIYDVPQRMANGVNEAAAQVRLKGAEDVIIPLNNLDVLE